MEDYKVFSIYLQNLCCHSIMYTMSKSAPFPITHISSPFRLLSTIFSVTQRFLALIIAECILLTLSTLEWPTALSTWCGNLEYDFVVQILTEITCINSTSNLSPDQTL